MATKREWLAYLVEHDAYMKKLAKYEKEIKQWVRKLPADDDEDAETADAPGSNPPNPPTPPKPPGS